MKKCCVFTFIICSFCDMFAQELSHETERVILREETSECFVDIAEKCKVIDFGTCNDLPVWNDVQGIISSVWTNDEGGIIYDFETCKHHFFWGLHGTNHIASCMFSPSRGLGAEKLCSSKLPSRFVDKRDGFDMEIIELMKKHCLVSHFGIVTIPNAIHSSDILNQDRSRMRIVRIRYLLCCVGKGLYGLLYEALDIDGRNRRGWGRVDFEIAEGVQSVHILSSKNTDEISRTGVNFVTTQSVGFGRPIQNKIEIVFCNKISKREDKRSVLTLQTDILMKQQQMHELKLEFLRHN